MTATELSARCQDGVERPVSGQRREKWETFWTRPRAQAEATHRRSAELVLDQLRDESPQRPLRLLDLGCGNGRVMMLMRASGHQVVGLDLANGAIEAARHQASSSRLLMQADAYQLGLADASFDGVVSLGYASVGSYQGVQDEVARVLRPNGVALVDFRHVGLYHGLVALARGRRLLHGWRHGEVALAMFGLRPSSAWAAAGLRMESLQLFNTFPPLGGRLSPTTYLAFEHQIGTRFAPLLARTALVKFRRG